VSLWECDDTVARSAARDIVTRCVPALRGVAARTCAGRLRVARQRESPNIRRVPSPNPSGFLDILQREL
jgi:hypothetical protein